MVIQMISQQGSSFREKVDLKYPRCRKEGVDIFGHYQIKQGKL
jgi:hypothetical protein